MIKPFNKKWLYVFVYIKNWYNFKLSKCQKLNFYNMKKLFTLGALLFAGTAFAQTENVGIGTVKPDKSAILDLSSNSKGFLLPRMSESQRLKIASPAQGLQVYQIDGSKGLYVYNGKDWENASNSVAGASDPWLRGGNSIEPGEFIGTTNEMPLAFKVFGQASGYISTYPANNAFFGYRAGAVSSNTTTSANNNIAIGSFALENISTGSNNFAIGAFALRSNSTGQDNFAMGNNALYNNNAGRYNFAIGPNALLSNTAGNSNIGIGQNAMQANISGSDNVAIGWNALFSATGNRTVAIGNEAGWSNTGSDNIFIGNRAGMNETGNNKLYIANSSTPTPLIYGDFTAKYVAIGDVSSAQRTQAKATGEYNLLVKGGILTEKVKVALATTTDWADYVFEPSYRLMPLDQVEKFTITHKHLPNVPSALEMVEKGLDVSSTNKMLMEKIEELTLYVIQLNKELQLLKNKK